MEEIKKEGPEMEETIDKAEEKEVAETSEDMRGIGEFTGVMKKALREAVASGKVSLALENVSGSLEVTKSAVESLAQVVERAREILKASNKKGKVGSDGAAVLSTTWLPMMLGLIKTPEFQNLTASMIANMLKE